MIVVSEHRPTAPPVVRIAWNDPFLNIQWPDLGEAPKLSAKDAAGNLWANARFFD